MQRLEVVDSHTCGQPTRVVIDGVPDLGDSSAADARELLRRDHDDIRRVAVFEPRGHPALLGAALLPPAAGSEAWRVVFMDAAGYPDMCGHATIGVATTLVDAELVKAPSGTSTIVLDTPGGIVPAEVRVRDGHVESVTVTNRPSFYLETVTIEIASVQMTVPIAYGGQWYGFVDATAVGLAVESRHVAELVRLSGEVRRRVGQSCDPSRSADGSTALCGQHHVARRFSGSRCRRSEHARQWGRGV